MTSKLMLFCHYAIYYFKMYVKYNTQTHTERYRHSEESNIISVSEKSGTFYVRGEI